MDWRNSKLFVYGYLPVRLVASGLAIVAGAVYCAAIFLMWFQPDVVKRQWDNLR